MSLPVIAAMGWSVAPLPPRKACSASSGKFSPFHHVSSSSKSSTSSSGSPNVSLWRNSRTTSESWKILVPLYHDVPRRGPPRCLHCACPGDRNPRKIFAPGSIRTTCDDSVSFCECFHKHIRSPARAVLIAPLLLKSISHCESSIAYAHGG